MCDGRGTMGHDARTVSRLRASGLPMEDDWLRRIGPAHFSHINFRGTYRFNLEKYGHLLVEHRSGKAAA